MSSTHMRIDKKIHHRLKVASAIKGVSMQELIKEMLDNLDKKGVTK